MIDKKCPICGGNSILHRKYGKESCIKDYKYLYKEIPENLDIIDYELYRCTNCDLVFAAPLIGGSESFYTWVTSHSNYYPTEENPRWEWIQIKEYLLQNKNVKTILEVGCGEGAFLSFIQKAVPGLSCLGIDTTTSACIECMKKGLDVYNGTLEEYINGGNKKKYDMVVAFHCLEHVEEPMQLAKEMLDITDEKGMCIVSFPYTDMKMEKVFITANNMPPHHLSHWNYKSCKKLAEVLAANMQIVSPYAPRIKDEVYQLLLNMYYPIWKPRDDINFFNVALIALIHPLKTLKAVKCVILKDRIVTASQIGKATQKRRVPWFVMLILERKDKAFMG